jgi:hypothetical protein
MSEKKHSDKCMPGYKEESLPIGPLWEGFLNDIN